MNLALSRIATFAAYVALLTTGVAYASPRRQLVDFSVPHTMVRSAIFVRKDSPIRSFADLRGKEVILQEGDVWYDFFRRTGLASRIVAVTHAGEQLRLLASGRGDCALMTSRLQGEYPVKRLGFKGLRAIDGDLPQLRYCFAVRRGNRELLYRLDEGLNVLKLSGKYREIYERWFGVYEAPDLWRYGWHLAFALAGLAAFLAASLLCSRSLRRQVRVRTAELRRAKDELEQRVEARTAELQRANEQLRASEAEKAIILNSMREVVVFLDPEMKIQWGNREAVAVARTSLDGLKGRHCWEAFFGRGERCQSCPVSLAMADGEPHSAEMSGGGMEILHRVYPVKDAQGRLLGTAAFILDITERKRMEEALRESEEWLKLTVEATGAGIVHTLPFEPPTLSPRCRAMFGLPDDFVIDGFEGFLRLIHPADRDRARDFTLAALDPSGDGRLANEARILRPDGSERWISTTGKVQFAKVEGAVRPVRIACIHLDVTERKRKEEALRESEERYARLAATVPGVLYEYTQDTEGRGRFTYLSPRFSEIFEVDRQSVLDDIGVLRGMADPADVRAIQEGSLAATQAGVPHNREVRVTTPSGRQKWIQFLSVPSSAPGEGPGRRSGIIIDVTERKRTEEALREAKEWLELAIEATGAGTLHATPGGAPATASPRFREMFGIADDAVVKDLEAFLRLVHAEDRDRVREAVGRAVDPSGDGRYEADYRCVRPDGRVRWIAAKGKVKFAEVEGVRRAVRCAVVTLDVTDRKREEEALRESEERFRTLADNIPQHAFIIDPQGRMSWENRRSLEFNGASGAGLAYLEVIHPEHRERVMAQTKRCFETGDTFEDTILLRDKTGAYHWFLCRAVPLRDDAGDMVRWFGTGTDVTEQRKVEEALRESEARARAILASLAEGIVLHDAEGRTVSANQAAQALLGRSIEEMAGRTVIDGPPPGWVLQLDGSAFPREEHPVMLALRTGSGQSGEFGMRRPDGSLVWLAAHAQPVRLPDDTVVGVVCSLFDVTQRKQALQRSEGHLRSVADNVPDAIVRFDREHRILFANQAVAAGLGVPVDRFIGKTREEIGRASEHAAAFDEHLLKVFRTGAPDEFEHFYEPGARRCEVRLVPERGPAGEIESVLLILRDITDRRWTEEQLLASREQLRDLVARLNSVREEEKARLSRELHDEMGQLLTALRMELEVLEDRLGAPSMPGPVRELLERAVAASELVARTIASMRSLLASLRPVALDRLGLAAALEQECRRFQEWAGVTCEVAPADGVSTFGSDVDTALFRIAQEGLTNVARHARASHVALCLEAAAGVAVLRIEDDGCGIPPGRESRGLGMLGMRERAERLRGQLVVNAGERGGTIVEARIPLSGPASREGAP